MRSRPAPGRPKPGVPPVGEARSASGVSHASVAAARCRYRADVGSGCKCRSANRCWRHCRPGRERRWVEGRQQWTAAERIREARFSAAAGRLPFATPVVIAYMRPDALDHVGFLIDGMQHRCRAPALSPLHAARIGLFARLTIVELATGTLVHFVFSVIERVAANIAGCKAFSPANSLPAR
jgi:hypothetical protein